MKKHHFLWVFFIVVMIPVIVNVTSDLISHYFISDKEQTKSSVMLHFWFDGKTEFVSGQKVIVYYKVDATNSQPLFFSLFNRTSSGEDWSPMLEYEAIEVGKLYSFSSALSGTEYFLAVVRGKAGEDLARKELVVEVR